jgi:hypothetical protein
VGRAVNGNGNLHALVRAEFISEIDLRCRFQRRELEDGPNLLSFMLSTLAQLSRAQSATAPVPEANPGRPTVSTPATLTPVGYLQFENGVLFAEHSFLEELESVTAQNPNFTLIPTVTGHRTLAWPYEKGHINRGMLTRYLLGLKGPVYYIAGPSGMVTAMTDLLNSSGVSDDDIKTEEFGDYKHYQDRAQSDQGTGNNRSDSPL